VHPLIHWQGSLICRPGRRAGGVRKLTRSGPLGPVAVSGEDADLAQVVFDRARAKEQPCADLRVGKAVAGEPGDLGLLSGELVARLDGAFTGGFAGGQQLARGALGERVHADCGEHLVRGAQLLARVEPWSNARTKVTNSEID
jgi:hypothetical protein